MDESQNKNILEEKKEKLSEFEKKLNDEADSLLKAKKNIQNKSAELKKRENDLQARERIISEKEAQTEALLKQQTDLTKEIADYKIKRINEIESECKKLLDDGIAQVEMRIDDEKERIEKYFESEKQKTDELLKTRTQKCEKLIEQEKKTIESLQNQKSELENSLIDYEVSEKTQIDKKMNEIRQEKFSEIEKEAEELRKIRISQVEKQIADELNLIEQNRQQKESENEKEIERLRAELSNRLEELSKEKSRADKAEAKIREQEIQLSTFASENKALNDSNANLQVELNDSSSNLHAKSSENENLKSQNSELRTQLEAKNTEITQYENIKSLTNEVRLETLINEIANLHENEEKQKKRESELDDFKKELDFESRKLERQKMRFSDEKLKEKVEEELERWHSDLILENDRNKERCEKLLKEIQDTKLISNNFEDLKAMLQENNLAEYEKIKVELAETTEKLQKVKAESQEKYFSLQREKDEIAKKTEELKAQKKTYDEAIAKSAKLSADNTALQTEKDGLMRENNLLKERVESLLSTYENPKSREERIEVINEPYIKGEIKRNSQKEIDECEWLKIIATGIKNYNIKLSDRILLSFHTALKSAEISPLTVLAGVSGTGKSLLPRLYSHFGGINFLSVAVEPNWDSQESMLGYYNSIENYFDAQPILRFLAQTQRPAENQNGLSDVMNLILLDEMNLANVELYFPEFLSKLEERRDYKDGDEKFPKLSVKIGAKMAEWQLPLGRNVLWTGTMNQDETTKTLSDKVLDRAIILSFPSPKELESRKNEIALPPQADFLSRVTWENWKKSDSALSGEIMKPFKDCVQKINESLGKAGRALGHRVWQSIESYMNLYPEVNYAKSDDEKQKAMKRAFEDQLVQKVMPKLRGLETRGNQGGVLGEIENIINDYSITGDFEKAKNQGYGQFMWCSSDYINENPDSPLLSEETEKLEENPESKDIPEIKIERSDSVLPEDADDSSDSENAQYEGYKKVAKGKDFYEMRSWLQDNGVEKLKANEIAKKLQKEGCLPPKGKNK